MDYDEGKVRVVGRNDRLSRSNNETPSGAIFAERVLCLMFYKFRTPVCVKIRQTGNI
jgi:hypothetical protein